MERIVKFISGVDGAAETLHPSFMFNEISAKKRFLAVAPQPPWELPQ